jgi:hypothetical protein
MTLKIAPDLALPVAAVLGGPITITERLFR